MSSDAVSSRARFEQWSLLLPQTPCSSLLTRVHKINTSQADGSHWSMFIPFCATYDISLSFLPSLSSSYFHNPKSSRALNTSVLNKILLTVAPIPLPVFAFISRALSFSPLNVYFADLNTKFLLVLILQRKLKSIVFTRLNCIVDMHI